MTFSLVSTLGVLSAAWLISWLPLLLVISSCGWILSDAAAKSTKEEWPPDFDLLTTPIQINIPEVQPLGKKTMWIGTMIVLLITLAATAGYGVRDHQLAVNTFTYEGVAVNSQVNDHQYWMTIPGYISQRDFEFCHPLKMPATVIDIRYEQKYGCKQVYGVGFVQPHKEKNNARIQNGRDSTAATETTAGLEGR